jgi:hypothetical protein
METQAQAQETARPMVGGWSIAHQGTAWGAWRDGEVPDGWEVWETGLTWENAHDLLRPVWREETPPQVGEALPLPPLADLAELVAELRPAPDAPMVEEEDGELVEAYEILTVGWTEKEAAWVEEGEWGWQTGDNSYSGAAYRYPHWAVVYLYAESEPEEVAREIRSQLADLVLG